MRLPVRQLLGLGGVPSDRSSASAWLQRNCVPTTWHKAVGCEAEFVHLSDLPSPERLAYLRRELDELHLDPGTYDDAAHEAFMRASPSRRVRAERKAAIARLLVSLGPGVPWAERLTLVHERFGEKGASKPRLKALLKAVKGIDPVNYAPALLDGHMGRPERADMSDDAWRMFLTTLRDAGESFPLIQAFRDVRDVAASQGWDWPKSYATVWRRWNELPAAQRIAIRKGRDEAIKQLRQPAIRDKSQLKAMNILSLDGRTKDFWADWGDGKPVRSTFLPLVDVASGMVLHWVLARSENAADTVRLIVETCEKFGIPSQIYTDNGSAFAGHLVAGGYVHRFRNPSKKTEGVQPLGVCHLLGIRLRFALPANGQAKIAERTFADLSRCIDDRPEFKNAHAGHARGAALNSSVVPVPVDFARQIIAREIDRYNREPGRRGAIARGRSYEQTFSDLHADRVPTKATERQLYLASLIYTPVAVDWHGRVKIDG